MRIAELVLSYVKTVQWPVVVVTLALVFRGSLRAIMRRLSELSGAGMSAKFEHQADEVAEQADAALHEDARGQFSPPPPDAYQSPAPQPYAGPGAAEGSPPVPPFFEVPDPARVWRGRWASRAWRVDPDYYNKHQTRVAERFRPLRQLAREEPERAVRVAWQELVRTAEELAAVQSLPRSMRLRDILAHLKTLGLSEEYVAMVRRLEEMYVAVEHHDARVTAKAATSYLRAARTLATALAPGYVPRLDEPTTKENDQAG